MHYHKFIIAQSNKIWLITLLCFSTIFSASALLKDALLPGTDSPFYLYYSTQVQDGSLLLKDYAFIDRSLVILLPVMLSNSSGLDLIWTYRLMNVSITTALVLAVFTLAKKFSKSDTAGNLAATFVLFSPALTRLFLDLYANHFSLCILTITVLILAFETKSFVRLVFGLVVWSSVSYIHNLSIIAFTPMIIIPLLYIRSSQLNESFTKKILVIFLSTCLIFIIGSVFLYPFIPPFVKSLIDPSQAKNLTSYTNIATNKVFVPFQPAFVINPLNAFLLGEVLTAVQFIAIALIIVGSVLISFQKTKKTSGFSRALLFALLSGLLFAFSHISAKYTYDHYHFWTGTVWTKGIMGVYALLLLLVPSVRKSVFKKSSKKVSHTHSSLVVVIANRILSILGTGLTQYAVALGSVSVVNALQGVQYAVLVILVLILTRFFPKVFREFYTRSEVILELIAVVVVAIGLVLLVK